MSFLFDLFYFIFSTHTWELRRVRVLVEDHPAVLPGREVGPGHGQLPLPLQLLLGREGDGDVDPALDLVAVGEVEPALDGAPLQQVPAAHVAGGDPGRPHVLLVLDVEAEGVGVVADVDVEGLVPGRVQVVGHVLGLEEAGVAQLAGHVGVGHVLLLLQMGKKSNS